jgi:hypothetical protein
MNSYLETLFIGIPCSDVLHLFLSCWDVEMSLPVTIVSFMSSKISVDAAEISLSDLRAAFCCLTLQFVAGSGV